MKAKIYYQDFTLNCDASHNDQLILEHGNAILIRDITHKDMVHRLGHISSLFIDKEEIAMAVWEIMNNLFIPEGHKDRPLFEKAGHTSMSVGDYILFEDGVVWQAGFVGWKIIHHYKVIKGNF